MSAALTLPARSASPVVWIALSSQGGPYAEAADAMRVELERAGNPAELVVRPWQELVRGEVAMPRLIVTVGVGALRGMAESGPRVPLLAALVPRAAYLNALGTGVPGPRAHSAVWLDQPAARQFDLMRLALPGRRKVAVLFGPESRIHEDDIQRAAAERKLVVAAGRVAAQEQLSAALRSIVEDSDALLALPDPQIYNGNTIQNVLMASYRGRIPVAAFSPAFVRAGAFYGLYSTPTQIGTQVGEIVRGTLAGRPLPPAQGPRDFVVGVNLDVARSLGLGMEADAAERWTEQLREKERGQ